MRDMTAFGCVSNTIRVRSGRYFDLANPKPDQFTFADIAGALSKICRFGGQVDLFYSVAEHLHHCAEQAEIDRLPFKTQQAVLMHDAAEAFIGDMVKPLKIMLPDYARIERVIEDVIGEKFGIDFHVETEAVRKIDNEMLIAERRALFSSDSVKWTGEDDVRQLSVGFCCWRPHDASSQFTKTARSAGINVNI